MPWISSEYVYYYHHWLFAFQSLYIASDANDNEHNECGRKCKRQCKRACDCRHDHYYRRHRRRRRTSSCEMIEIHHKNGGNRSTPMCRSKSNVELCRYRRSSRRRSNNRSDSTASSESGDDNRDGSSSESCCEHTRHTKRRCAHHRNRSAPKGGGKHKNDNSQSTAKKDQKNDVPAKCKCTLLNVKCSQFHFFFCLFACPTLQHY